MNDEPCAATADLDAVCRNIHDLVATAGGRVRRITLRSGEASVEIHWSATPPGDEPATLRAAGKTAAPADGAEPADGEPEDGLTYVRAPLVGTFYRAQTPGASPFVDVGETVEAGQRVGTVEAMKLLNPIEAPTRGTVVEILVGDAQPVHYGQPLLSIAGAETP